jgi:hypothetical protein
MGTNYYWRDRICTPCGRYDEIHVGKGGALFRGYRHVLLNTEHPDWGYSEHSPFDEPVLSRSDWLRILAGRPGELYDEYGKRIPNPIGWLAALTPPAPEQIRQQDADRAAERAASRWQFEPEAGTEWRDAEGFRFYAREFS